MVNECKNQCIENENQPIHSMINWWKLNENSIDFESSMCLIDMALENNLI
jgi:hypothetical protein